MDYLELEHSEENAKETYGNPLLSLDSPGINELYGEPSVLPRVGDQYQAEIPPLVAETKHPQLRSSPIGTDDMFGIDNNAGIGLSIPILWLGQRGAHIKDEQQELPGTNNAADESASMDSRNNKRSRMDAKCSIATRCPPEAESLNNHTKFASVACKVKLSDEMSDHSLVGSSSLESTALNNQMNMNSCWLQLRKARIHCPVPGLPTTPWKDAEEHSFLLGLYIFGKNIVQLRKFIGCKETGDILSYYYGKFYRSDAYRRWEECRKIRSRKCVHGQRIFTGWRQQEILSRVSHMKSKEVQDAVQEIIKRFNEGRASLEEFVLSLKDAVGMQVLVQAVGIGKGKHDLTGTVLDPVKTNPVPSRPEIPIGKACAALTSVDIVKFLTGDFRLSKARSNDLFWEAVWPRLLAKGWHSEQPKDIVSVGYKHVLVFMVPGIKKFSRNKLVKGKHYFDSVSDVLNKVAEDPGILELEIDVAGSSENKEECRLDLDTGSASGYQRHSYLRPRHSDCNSELMKFTIVDTSLVQRESPFSVRELRTLPVNIASNYDCPTSSGETGNDSSDEQHESPDTPTGGLEHSGLCTSDAKKLEESNEWMLDKGIRPILPDNIANVTPSESLERMIPITGLALDVKCPNMENGKKPVKDVKRKFSRRVKSGQPVSLGPVSKLQRLTPCGHEGDYSKRETSDFESSKESSIRGADFHPFCGEFSCNSSAKNSLDRSSEFAVAGNCHETSVISKTTISQVKRQPRVMLDLNLPVPPDFDTVESFCIEVDESHHDLNRNDPLCHFESNQQVVDSQLMETSNSLIGDPQPSTSIRRQSTRNRPPTTKALEALACGFLGTKRKGKGTRVDPIWSNYSNRPPRRARITVETPAPAPNPSPTVFCSDIKESDARIDEWYSSNPNHANVLKSHAQSEGRGTHELFGIP